MSLLNLTKESGRVRILDSWQEVVSSMLLGTLGASLLWNLLAGKGIVRAGSGNTKGKEIVRAGTRKQ